MQSCPSFQASSTNQLTADYPGNPGWEDNAATFEMIIASNTLHGDYQLANGYGHDKAKEVLKVCKATVVPCFFVYSLALHN